MVAQCKQAVERLKAARARDEMAWGSSGPKRHCVNHRSSRIGDCGQILVNPGQWGAQCSVMKSRCANVTVDLETPIISFVDLFRQENPLRTLPYIKDRSNRGFHRICRYDVKIDNSEILDRFVQKWLIMLSTSVWDQIKSRAQEPRGEKYSIYCLRHFYAVNAQWGLACSRSPATWGPRFKLFRNIPGSRPRRPCLRPGSGIDEYSA